MLSSAQNSLLNLMKFSGGSIVEKIPERGIESRTLPTTVLQLVSINNSPFESYCDK